MSAEAKKLLSAAGARSSEFWAVVLGMGATMGGTKLGVDSSVLIAMWGAVSAYVGARSWHKNARVKALAALGAGGGKASQ